MSYTVILGDLGPQMPIGLQAGGAAFPLDTDNDTVVLRYTDPAGTVHHVDLTIINAPTGQCEAVWVGGDLPAVGIYRGKVTVTRVSGMAPDQVPDTTFPRTFPNDDTDIIWAVYKAV